MLYRWYCDVRLTVQVLFLDILSDNKTFLISLRYNMICRNHNYRNEKGCKKINHGYQLILLCYMTILFYLHPRIRILEILILAWVLVRFICISWKKYHVHADKLSLVSGKDDVTWFLMLACCHQRNQQKNQHKWFVSNIGLFKNRLSFSFQIKKDGALRV